MHDKGKKAKVVHAVACHIVQDSNAYNLQMHFNT